MDEDEPKPFQNKKKEKTALDILKELRETLKGKQIFDVDIAEDLDREIER